MKKVVAKPTGTPASSQAGIRVLQPRSAWPRWLRAAGRRFGVSLKGIRSLFSLLRSLQVVTAIAVLFVLYAGFYWWTYTPENVLPKKVASVEETRRATLEGREQDSSADKRKLLKLVGQHQDAVEELVDAYVWAAEVYATRAKRKEPGPLRETLQSLGEFSSCEAAYWMLYLSDLKEHTQAVEFSVLQVVEYENFFVGFKGTRLRSTHSHNAPHLNQMRESFFRQRGAVKKALIELDDLLVDGHVSGVPADLEADTSVTQLEADIQREIAVEAARIREALTRTHKRPARIEER